MEDREVCRSVGWGFSEIREPDPANRLACILDLGGDTSHPSAILDGGEGAPVVIVRFD